MRLNRSRLTLGVLVILFLSAPLQAQTPDWSYRYYKDTVELTFYPYEIALYDPTPPVTLLPGHRQVLLPNGDVATADDLAGGWSVLNLSIPGAADPVAYTTGLIEAYATDPNDDLYAAPVFGDETLRKFGKNEVHVGFVEGTPQATVDAVLGAAGVGTILESDWIRPGIYRSAGALRSGIDLLDIANNLAMDPDVRFASLNWRYMGELARVEVEPAPLSPFWSPSLLDKASKSLAPGCLPLSGESIPDDPLFHTQWWLEQFSDLDLDAVAAWQVCTGDGGTTILAILDDGVQPNHPDLSDNILPGDDTTEDCFSGPLPCEGEPLNYEADFHGTAVAGMAVAVAGNNEGTVGLAPNIKIVSIRVAKWDNVNGTWKHSAESSWVGNGLKRAIGLGARVTSMSLNFGEDEDNLMHEGYVAAAEAGLMNFNSAGNFGLSKVDIPGRYPEVHAISGIAADGSRLSYSTAISNIGSSVAFSGPGQQIVTTDLGGQAGYSTTVGGQGYNHTTIHGTSFASPTVAALAALIFSIRPEWTAADVLDVLKRSAVDLGDPGRDDLHGDGFINALAALLLARDGIFWDNFENGNTYRWSFTEAGV